MKQIKKYFNKYQRIFTAVIITIMFFPLVIWGLYNISKCEEKLSIETDTTNINTKVELYAKIELTEKQYYILASIIEAEAQRKECMPKISAVFHNRLNRDMKLQSCATVNFVRQVNGLPFKLHLSENDTDIKSPCNTYLNYGLPLFPICVPSKEAIDASYNPYPDTKLLFFKYDAKTDREVFSYSYKEHKNL